MDGARFEVQRLDHWFNEDVMGRCLDSLYEEGVSELYQDIAARVVTYLP